MTSGHADLQFVILIFFFVTATVLHSSDAGYFNSGSVLIWLGSSFSLHAQRKRKQKKRHQRKKPF
ncbi:MAG: hypothetical protein ACJA2C_000844 [Marinoscillum sp.]|jgi:hypothetical protein